MISCRKSFLLFAVLASQTGDRIATAFVLKSKEIVFRPHGTTCVDGKYRSSGSALILNSFSYLDGLTSYLDDLTGSNEENVAEVQTTTFEPPQQPFPFASPTIPSPATPVLAEQQQQEIKNPETELYYENDVNLNFPAPPIVDVSAIPEPSVIAGPYDFPTVIEEEGDEYTEFAEVFPTVVAPVPQANTGGAIARATSRTVTPAVNHNVRNIWETDAPAAIQGDSLKTWNFNSERIQAVQVLCKTNGRPLKADIELWQGENAPQKISVYTEDGEKRPLSAFICTPYQGPTAIAVKNSATMEFPLQACVEADLEQHNGLNDFGSFGPGYGNHLAKNTLQTIWDTARPKTVQGDGATYVVPFEADIGRVQILISSENNPINARIEILEGPNNVKQVLEITTEDGKARPFFCVLELPDKVLANVMRVVNTGPLEFPIECRVKPFEMEKEPEVDLGDDQFNYFFDDVGPAEAAAASGPFLLS